MKLVKVIVGALLLALMLQSTAMAAEQLTADSKLAKSLYYTDTKFKGYSKGDFVVLEGDDINFREQAENGKVLKVLPRHSLLRVLKQQGEWLQADSDGTQGYIYAPYTRTGVHEPLTIEDFAVGYAALGEKFDEHESEAKLGKLAKMTVNKKNEPLTCRYKYTELRLTKQKITSIRTCDPSYITMRGVSVGDSAGRAVGQYGLPDSVLYGVGASGKTIYEYFLPTENKKQHLRFALEIDSTSHVQGIILELVDKKK